MVSHTSAVPMESNNVMFATILLKLYIALEVLAVQKSTCVFRVSSDKIMTKQ